MSTRRKDAEDTTRNGEGVCVCVAYRIEEEGKERENSGKVSSLRNDTSGLYSGNAG